MKMLKKNLFKIVFFLLFFITNSYGQLSSFTLNVTQTNETCTGNGALSFSVSSTVSGATMDFAIYLLPNTTTPIATVTSLTFTGLNAGNYRVIATQSLAGNSSSKQQDVTISNAIQSLAFTISGLKVKCANDGIIYVNVSSGIPVSYQLISGPITTPLQNSNSFTGLSSGVYQIKVIDSCGEVVVQTYTLLQESVSLIVDPVIFQTLSLSSCNSILVSNFFGVLTGSIIAFPLTFNYTVFPPSSGTPITFSQTLTSGSVASQIIPFYNDQSYYYDLQVVDACGNVYNKNNNIVNKKFDFDFTVIKVNCIDLVLKLQPKYYVAPYTINFLTYPVGFNPLVFNANHPGPFNGIFTTYGSDGNGFPVGEYSVQITDACGRSATKNVSVASQNPTPVGVNSNNGCGGILILVNDTQMVSVVLINAPSGYSLPLPHDYSSNISTNGLQFSLTGFPQGNYSFQVTDLCGIVTVVTVTVSPYVPANLSIIRRPGCEIGYGGLVVNDATPIASAILVNAPTSYTGTLPVNLTANVVLGAFYFGSVPQGTYTFQFTSACGAVRTSPIFVEGYQTTVNTVNITQNCGSFNLYLQNLSNGIFYQSYWLQKLNPMTGEWTNPATGSVYTAGSDLTFFNATQLTNNANNINLAFSGKFRVLKMFRTLMNTDYINCISVLKEFEVLDAPKINNVYAFLCSSNTNEVIVEATGLPPLEYSITTKNGLPFVLNNGSSNSFTNLESAVYNFQVKDVCGNIVNSLFDISAQAPLTIQATPFCNGQVGSLSVTQFSFLSYQWWKGSATTTILSTTSSLDFPTFNAATDFGTYHVRITNINGSSSCVDVVLDYIIPNNSSVPNAGIGTIISYCGSQGSIDLFSYLTGTFDTNGTWQEVTSSGLLTNNLWNSNVALPGTYQFKYRVDGLCSVFDESLVEITINEIPQIPIASIEGVICEGSNIQLFASSIPEGSYEWTGPNGFVSDVQNPIIENGSTINNGTYYVKSVTSSCESEVASVEVAIAIVPQFSINFDCINDNATLTATMLNTSFDETAAVYNWSSESGFSSSVNPTSITGQQKGVYTLTVTNELGCSTTKTIEVAATTCKIPKGISPNNDGANDTFDLSGFSGVRGVKIFNRYGMVVFEQDNYTNQWHGQQKNNDTLLPDGTYYYVVNFENEESKTGWVYLNREK